MNASELPPNLCTAGLSGRKLKILKNFASGRNFNNISECSPDKDSVLILWGRFQIPKGFEGNVRIVRMEDGFLRSVGLGADLINPVSWVFDQKGIYFDSTCSSDLESILQTTLFLPVMQERAARLRERIVAENLTKYNVGTGNWKRPAEQPRVILVPGQVESDASLAYGAPGINTNMGLLKAVREANSDAWVVYKPHPDVLAGLRAKGQQEEQALQWCNEQVTDISMGDLLSDVDELHTMTSLAGFEALLRGKRVVCYGQPFYSGWGLTDDIIPVERRTRRLNLDELVTGALILYPTYISRITGMYTTPEQALEELIIWRDKDSSKSSLLSGIKRMILRRVVGVK